MITRIEVDGFKSLRGFAMDLEPFTVLVGPNSAGKSNVLDAIALLSRLASLPVAEAFKRGRGRSIDQFSRYDEKSADVIRFGVELLVFGLYPRRAAPASSRETFQSRFRYELTIERRTIGRTERLIARNELLRAMCRDDDRWIAAHPALAPFAGYRETGQDLFLVHRDDRGEAIGVRGLDLWPDKLNLPRTQTVLASVHLDEDPDLMIGSWKDCHVLDATTVIGGAASERIGSGLLAADGSNLPTVLAELPPNILGEIRADLVSLVPGIASFHVTPLEDEIRLTFELSGGERMPARLVSAGTLRILAILTALRMEPRPSTLCIEEPENGLYPGRLRALLEVLREATTRSYEDELRERLESRQATHGMGPVSILVNQLPTQVILTTHSPVALAALRARPEHLRFVDMVRRDGQRLTRVRTVGKPSGPASARAVVSAQEIDAIMDSVRWEEAP